MPDVTQPFIRFRIAVLPDWAVLRVSAQPDLVKYRISVSNWATFRIQTHQPWFKVRVRTGGLFTFRASIKRECKLEKLKFELLPLDYAVQITAPQPNQPSTLAPDRTLCKVFALNGEEVLTAQVPTEPSWLFISDRDGVYRVLLQDADGNSLSDEYIVVNNRTLLLLDEIRREDQENCSLDEYELVLAMNYTALDNWRVGDYAASKAMFNWLEDYTLERRV